jgi:hypothetical protein
MVIYLNNNTFKGEPLMNKLTELAEKFSKTKILLLSLGAFVILMLLTNTLFKPSFHYLTQTFHYSPEEAYRLLSDIGTAGRRTHLLVFTSDVLMVLFYTAFLTGANYLTYKSWLNQPKLLSLICFLPFVLAMIQLSEVILLTVLILHYPAKFYGLARITDLLTILKYYVTTICFLLPIPGFLVTITLKLIKNKLIIK